MLSSQPEPLDVSLELQVLSGVQSIASWLSGEPST
jgi:hypothetical protein